MHRTLRQLARWEYDLLVEESGKKYAHGFKEWFRTVFMVDEAWEEIREDWISNNIEQS